MQSLELRKRRPAGRGLVVAAVALGLAGCSVTQSKTVTIHRTETVASGTTTSGTATSSSGGKAAAPSALSQSQLGSPVAIVAAATKAGEQAGSLRMSGSIADNGRRVALNMIFERGVGYAGTMAVDSMNLAIVSVGGQVYFKYAKSEWITLLMKDGFSRAEAEQMARTVGGRWIKMSAAENRQMSQYFGLDALLGKMESSHGVLKRESDSTVNGQRAIVVTDTTKGGSLYVAANGAPYPLMLTKTKSSGAGSIMFSDYGASVHIEAPANPLSLGSTAGVPVEFQPGVARRNTLAA